MATKFVILRGLCPRHYRLQDLRIHADRYCDYNHTGRMSRRSTSRRQAGQFNLEFHDPQASAIDS